MHTRPRFRAHTEESAVALHHQSVYVHRLRAQAVLLLVVVPVALHRPSLTPACLLQQSPPACTGGAAAGGRPRGPAPLLSLLPAPVSSGGICEGCKRSHVSSGRADGRVDSFSPHLVSQGCWLALPWPDGEPGTWQMRLSPRERLPHCWLVLPSSSHESNAQATRLTPLMVPCPGSWRACTACHSLPTRTHCIHLLPRPLHLPLPRFLAGVHRVPLTPNTHTLYPPAAPPPSPSPAQVPGGRAPRATRVRAPRAARLGGPLGVPAPAHAPQGRRLASGLGGAVGRVGHAAAGVSGRRRGGGGGWRDEGRTLDA